MDTATLKKRMKEYKTDAESLWTKCPKCHNIVYIKEVEKLNKCPEMECGYVYPYPFIKVQELKEAFRTKAMQNNFSKLVLKILDSTKSQKEREAFLSETYNVVLSESARQRAMKGNIS